jgi:hypothetical protein
VWHLFISLSDLFLQHAQTCLSLSLSLGCVTVTDILLFVLLCLHTSAWWIGVLHGRQHAGLAPRVGSYAVLQRIRVIAWYLGLLVIACTSFLVTPMSYCPFALPFHFRDMLLEHYQMLLEGTSCVPHCNIFRSACAYFFRALVCV